jgi:para-aminobenzoate synthetase component 1
MDAGNALTALKQFHASQNDWIFGHLAYDLKNEIETLTSSNPDHVGFPDLFFFVPQVILELSERSVSIGSVYNDHHSIWDEICSTSPAAREKETDTDIRSRYTKEEYIRLVEKLRQHILRGDCYEINLCQEFFAENAVIDPVSLHVQLGASSPNPFSAFYKLNDRFLSCMSPERYLKKEGRRLLSQPIKGTARRHPDNPALDALNLLGLTASDKERAENIMVVDLVRNDLSRICKEGTVRVDELCAVYSFPQVYQMVSSVSGEQKDDTHWTEAISATFPMGSMTGAPKKKVMELIERYETARRGLFSGSIGYVRPSGDFDFNVVIRSVLYNAADRYLSFQTGSAITFSSDPEKEYEECLLKAAAIKKALAETNTFH